MSSGLSPNQLASYDDIVSLNDIKGYWDMSYSHDFNEQDMWKGQFILYEDGWFEGIVIDPASPYLKDRFVFGVYFPNKGIELLKVTPSEVSSPFIFRGKKDAKGYDGNFNAIGLFGEQEMGVSHITTQESELQDTQDLETRIDAWKESMVGDENNFLYENTVQMRFQMIKTLKAQYEGRKLPKEEVDKILEEWEPMNENVVEQTAEEVKKLVLESSSDFQLLDDDEFDYDDLDDLPF